MNVRLLCAKSNLQKSDKILLIGAWLARSALMSGLLSDAETLAGSLLDCTQPRILIFFKRRIAGTTTPVESTRKWLRQGIG
jgi:hypothetical protein